MIQFRKGRNPLGELVGKGLKYIAYTSQRALTHPVEVLNDSNFTVIILHVVTNVVLFYVRADVFLRLLIVTFVELERLLKNTMHFSRRVQEHFLAQS